MVKRAALPLVCAAWLALAVAVYAVAGAPAGVRGAGIIAVHLGGSVAMLLAWWLARDGRGWGWILTTGVVARLLLAPVPSFTTHDVDRYLWDGRVLLAGLDPYRVRPDDAEVADVREDWPVAEEHAAYPTLYPPGALLLFAGCALVGPDAAPQAWKGVATFFSLVLLFTMAMLLRTLGRERHLALVALSPLLLLEAGVGAHVDVVATAALALGLWFWVWGQRGLAGAAFASGALCKMTPALAWLPLFVASGSRRGRLRMLAGAVAVGVAGYGFAVLLGLAPVGSLGVFFATWRFGSPVGAVLSWLPGGAWVGVVLALAGLVAAVWWAKRAPYRAAMLAVSVPLIVSPVVFPWYLMVLVPLVAIRPSALVIAWLTSAPLTYEVIDGFDAEGSWQPATWPLVAIVAAWAVGLAIDLAVARRRRGDQL